MISLKRTVSKTAPIKQEFVNKKFKELSHKVSDLKSHTIHGESSQKQGLQDVGPVSMMDKNWKDVWQSQYEDSETQSRRQKP